jgi:hypothetical protein
MMDLILLAFSIFPKLNLGAARRREAGRQKRAAGNKPFVTILDII